MEVIVVPGSYAGIGEAPADGTYYSRQNGVWVESPGASGGEANTLEDKGVGEGELAGGKVGSILYVKSIKAGTNVTIDNAANEITINAAAGSTTVLNETFDNTDLDGSYILTKSHSLGRHPAAVTIYNPSSVRYSVGWNATTAEINVTFEGPISGTGWRIVAI